MRCWEWGWQFKIWARADLTEKITLLQKFEESTGFCQAANWIRIFRADKIANVKQSLEVGMCLEYLRRPE